MTPGFVTIDGLECFKTFATNATLVKRSSGMLNLDVVLFMLGQGMVRFKRQEADLTSQRLQLDWSGYFKSLDLVLFFSRLKLGRAPVAIETKL